MSWVTDAEECVESYLSGDYEIRESKGIPKIEDVPFGKIAIKVKLCAFSIDLRKSTDLLFSHEKQTAGKIHKAFLHVAAATVRENDGFIRSFKGDSLLAFWPGDYKAEITKATRAALKLKYLLGIRFKEKFGAYSDIDFGIGLDWGDVYVIRVGLPRDPSHNDLVFIGKCVNYAVAIGEQAHGTSHVEISPAVYSNLEPNALYTDPEKQSGNIWHDGTVRWQDQDYASKLTDAHIKVE